MELKTQEFLRALLVDNLDEYEEHDVVINDWTILDGTMARSPYIIIENAPNVETDQRRVYSYDLPITLVVSFVDWQETLNGFRTFRQNIVNLLAGNNSVTKIKSTTEIAEMHDVYDRHEDSLPVFIMQKYNVSVVAKD